MVMAKKIVFEIIADSDCTDVYKRQQFNAGSERHSWGGFILGRIPIAGLPSPCDGVRSYLNQMALVGIEPTPTI